MRRSPKVAEVLPILYLRGLSTGDFRPALESLLGEEAAGLSATNIARLTACWEKEYADFRHRDLSGREYVYVWVDGVHFNIRLEDDRLCTLVIIGTRPNGEKELLAVEDGYRESAESWKSVLRELKRRGMAAPVLAVGDGALGFWAAAREVWPETGAQSCWCHKLSNVLDKLRGPRFIRSCSAPLAPTVLTKLENRFGAPVLEAYGMTEGAHQVATNPLPPLVRKPGTVGRGAGISVIDQTGRHLTANTPGEVVVRGPNVMRGYRNNPEANDAAFIDGWFRTGDIGVIDNDGYLALTGRIKDLINRGGEKISPGEVEAVLLEHPAVAEAAVFGVPDPKYGEEVSAGVVLRGAATPQELQKYCGARLADFKVPKLIHLVSAIPRNAMGKVLRNELTALFS
jgi:AMP-binding enzyme/Transposase, Mutator family/AMP-binding enzyme C-terminal domain